MSGGLTLSGIEGYSVEHLYAASTQWSAAAELLESQAEGIHSETLHPGGTRWAGDGADAAADRAWNDVVTSRAAGEAMRSGAAIARNGADDLMWAKQQEQQAIADAEGDGFAVSEGLQVSDPSTGVLGRQTAARQALQQEHADAIAAGAARLAAMDQAVAGQVSTAMAPLSQVRFSGPDMAPAGRPKPGDKGRDPSVQAVDYHPGDKPGDPGQNQPGASPAAGQQDQSGLSPAQKNLLLPPDQSGSQPSANKPDSAAGQAGKPPTTVADLLAGQGQQPAAGAAAPGQPGAPANPLDALKAQMQGGAGPDPNYTRNPLTAPIVKADPSVIGQQAAKVQADRQAVDAAQARVDASVNQSVTSGPYNGHDLNDNNPLARQLFDARHNLAADSKVLDNLNAAAAESGAPTAPHAPLPANTGVQAFPPEPGFAERAPQEFADSNRAVHNLTGGLVPDFVQDGHTAAHWGEASPAERAQAIADAAGMVPLPGMKLGAEGLEHLAGPAADAFAHGAPPVATHELTVGGGQGGTVHGDAPPPVEHHVDVPPVEHHGDAPAVQHDVPSPLPHDSPLFDGYHPVDPGPEFTHSDGSLIYPDDSLASKPYAIPGTVVPDVHLPAGTELGRFGYPGGGYLAPDGTPFAQLALPPDSALKPYFQYEVVDPHALEPGWHIEESQAAPWFHQPGGGTQYRVIAPPGVKPSVQALIDMGYLDKVRGGK